VTDFVKAELLGFFFQRGNEALIQTNGDAALPADDVMMVMIGLLGKI